MDERRRVEDERLQRLEEKMDRLTDYVVDLARLDEKVVSILKWVGDHETRLRPLEKTLATVGWVERLVWLAVAVIAPVLVQYMLNH
jgi:D-serine deaminase-like pyridoxal phosphate-dependent protein